MINEDRLKKIEAYEGAAACNVTIAIGTNVESKNWKTLQVSWPQLVTAFSETHRTSETYSEYRSSDKDTQSRIKDVGGFVGGGLNGKIRKKEFLTHRSLLTFDWDTVDIPLEDLITKYKTAYGNEAALYTSHSHSPAKPKARLVLPVARDLAPEEYEAIMRKMAQEIGLEMIDPASFRPVQLMFWPSTAHDGEFTFCHIPGAILDPDKILDQYSDPLDMSEWATTDKEHPLPKQRRTGNQADPTKKRGLIGQFCRAYAVQDAIEAFLPDKFLPTGKADRYTYAGASTSAGAVIYDGQFLFSNHGTDPHSGKLLNAYDLVRLHLFGDGPTSNNQMLQLVQKDSKVTDLMIQEEFGSDLPEEGIKDFIEADGRGQSRVNPIKLAQHIRDTAHYKIVRKNGQDSDLLYWYDGGRYLQTSPNEFKGRIKEVIPQPLRKSSILDEAYKDLITDLNTANFEDLNTDDRYINFTNGLYDIATGQLLQHSPQILYTRQTPYDWDPAAPRPKRFLKYIEELTDGDQELQYDIQEYLGLTLSNMPGYLVKKALVLYGVVGNTGKTQLTKVVADLLGREYVANTPIQRLSDRFALSELMGARCLLVDDQKAGMISDSSVFKTMTGGGYLSMEIKGKTPFPFRFSGTYIITTNELPYLDDKGTHMFERFLVIPADRVIPEEQRDPFIFDAFKKYEMPGVIRWALEGLHRLIANDMKFTPSKKADDALKKYRAMNDTLRAYIDDQCARGEKGDRIARSDFHRQYQSWCRSEGRTELSTHNIGKRMEQNGFKATKFQGNYYYEPIRYKAWFDDEEFDFLR